MIFAESHKMYWISFTLHQRYEKVRCCAQRNSQTGNEVEPMQSQGFHGLMTRSTRAYTGNWQEVGLQHAILSSQKKKKFFGASRHLLQVSHIISHAKQRRGEASVGEAKRPTPSPMLG